MNYCRSLLIAVTTASLLTGCIFSVDYEKPEIGEAGDAGSDATPTEATVSIAGPDEVIVESDEDGQFQFTIDYDIQCEGQGCSEQLWCAINPSATDQAPFEPCAERFEITEDDAGEGIHRVVVEFRDDQGDQVWSDDEITTAILFDFSVRLEQLHGQNEPIEYGYPTSTDVNCSRDDCQIFCRWEDTDGEILEDSSPDCDRDSIFIELPQEYAEAVLVVGACVDIDPEPDVEEGVEYCADEVSYHFEYYEPFWLAVSTGEFHTCAIFADDSLWCWGDNGFGQRGDDDGDGTVAERVTIEEQWQEVATGKHHTCAIDAGGALYCWGANSVGQTDPGAPGAVTDPQLVDDDHTWEVISAGGSHSCGITDDGALYCWGANSRGQLGTTDNSEPLRHVAIPAGYDSWLDVSAGDEHSCAIAGDSTDAAWDTAFCWGRHDRGRLGVDQISEDLQTPTETVFDEVDYQPSAVFAGRNHTYFLVQASPGNPDNTVRTVFYAGAGEDGVPPHNVDPNEDTWIYKDSFGFSEITDSSFTTGAQHACGIQLEQSTSGIARCWGQQADGRLGNNKVETETILTPIIFYDFSKELTAIAAGGHHTCGITDEADLYCWGRNDEGQLGTGDNQNHASPEPMYWPHAR